MCGIFGAINGSSVTNSLVAGLNALSYRGYDSAGIAIMNGMGLDRRRAEGKLENLSRALDTSPLDGRLGIAHTRWATHGAPTVRNAHPHMTDRVAVAHNGIIENYRELREELETEGYHFQSETDSEAIPQLITRYLDQGMSHAYAMRAALSRLEGSFAVAAIFNDRDDELYAARRGSPLVVGQAEGGYYLSSDANALLNGKTQSLCYLEDGDMACLWPDRMMVIDMAGKRVDRPLRVVDSVAESSGKGKYRHYMLKEIHEQPQVFERTLANCLGLDGKGSELQDAANLLARADRLSLVACGTSYYAGMVAKYWLEGLAGLPVDLDIASEYRYRKAPLSKKTVALFISQSGETADTLAALRHAKQAGQSCLSVVNVPNSTMAYESDRVLRTLAGPEIGVASTKAFTSQLAVMAALTLATARARGCIDSNQEWDYMNQLLRLPALMEGFLNSDNSIERIAKGLVNARNMLYLGRGVTFPLALEGALKLKEISYIHAEAYPAGELKHGPIALVDSEMPVVVIAPPNELFAKTLSNLREVTARGAKVLLISNKEGVRQTAEFIKDAIVMPDVDELLQPVLYCLPLQLLAYRVAVLKGTDVDQPRNLAKSVTVE